MKTKTIKDDPKKQKIKSVKNSVTKTRTPKSEKIVTKDKKTTKAAKSKKDISEIHSVNDLQELTKGKYLNNKELLAEVKISKQKGAMTDKLAKMLMLLCMKYAKKGNFVNYSYNDDMQAFAALMLVKTWNAFDPEKSDNPFAFFTQCIHHSFIQFLNQEKRQRNIKDELLVNQGLSPSYNYDTYHEETDNVSIFVVKNTTTENEEETFESDE